MSKVYFTFYQVHTTMKQETNTNWVTKGKRNTWRLGLWTLAWVLSVALATFGPHFLWAQQSLTIIALMINLGLGIGLIVSNKVYLAGLDELDQKIQLEAMALSLGVGLVAGIGYSLMDVTNLIASDAEISHLIILMAIAYMVGIAVGKRRYR